MKAMLGKTTRTIWHFVDGKKIDGAHENLSGDVADLWGDVSGLCGDVSDLCGDVSGLRGDVTHLYGDASGLRGDVTDLRGDFDSCEITEAERLAGVDVTLLVAVGGGAQ